VPEDDDEPDDSFAIEPDDSFVPEPLDEDEDEDGPEPDPDPEPSEPVFAGVALSPLEDPLSDPVEEPPSEPLEDDDFRALAPRSFFAQPDPLKWIVGAVNALRMSVLPQTGQLAGPASLTPWSTSKRCPLAHT
jgi:hypothetical protein